MIVCGAGDVGRDPHGFGHLKDVNVVTFVCWSFGGLSTQPDAAVDYICSGVP